MYKKHLEGGVKKGALTDEQATEKFQAWLDQKDGKITGKKDSLTTAKADARKAALAAEAKKKDDRAAAIVAKNTPPAEEVEVIEEAEAPVAEVAAPAAEAEVEAPAAEAEPEAPAAEADAESAE